MRIICGSVVRITPGRKEILAEMENDGEKVVEEIILGKYEKPVVFMKHMAHPSGGTGTGISARDY